jgi:hypothetical protein
MGFFDKVKGLPLDTSSVLIATVMSLVVFQAFGLVFGKGLNLDVKLGPIFVLLPLGIAALVGVGIVKKMMMGLFISKQDLFAVVVILLIALIAMFWLPEIVPEVFSREVSAMQSIVGLG